MSVQVGSRPGCYSLPDHLSLLSAGLPFYLLVRFSVYLTLTHGMGAWSSLSGGILATIGLLCFYLIILSFWVSNKKLLIKLGGLVARVMVLGYSLFSLFYLSGVNAKSEDIQSVYRSMHPILRVAVSTVTLADNDLVITDIERIEEDYASQDGPPHQPGISPLPAGERLCACGGYPNERSWYSSECTASRLTRADGLPNNPACGYCRPPAC